MRDSPEHFDAVGEPVALAHLLDLNALRAVATDEEVDVCVLCADARHQVHEEVGALPIDEPTEHHYHNCKEHTICRVYTVNVSLQMVDLKDMI